MNRHEHLKVLIIEDQAIVSAALADELEASGFQVMGVVDSVGAALALLNRETPDIAVVDLRLRGGERADTLAAALSRSGVRTIVLSGERSPSPSLALVNHTFLQKPASPCIVAAMLSSGAGSAAVH